MKLLRFLPLTLCALLATPVAGQVQAIHITNTTSVVGPYATGGAALGLNFTPTQNIWVTNLGWWDPSSWTQPLPDLATVGIYSPTSLVASAVIPSGTTPQGPTGLDSFAWANVSSGPVELFAGTTYTLEGIGLGNAPYAGVGASSFSASSGFYSPGDFFAGSAVYGFDGTSLPSSPNMPYNYGYYVYAGPNFAFSTSSVPEESSLLTALLGLGLSGAGLLVRRRIHKSLPTVVGLCSESHWR